MVLVETTIFTRQLLGLLSDDEYRRLQVVLASRPSAGTLIKGSGGLRKMRWASGGRGKRGGVRVIYYWLPGVTGWSCCSSTRRPSGTT
ncbi:MAG: hypothetical protein ACT4P5_18365 [Armatimonadota bacterium]